MKHEEFLKQVKERASSGNQFIMCSTPKEVLKLIAIIEKLKEQRSREYAYDSRTRAGIILGDDKELDEIVGLG